MKHLKKTLNDVLPLTCVENKSFEETNILIKKVFQLIQVDFENKDKKITVEINSEQLKISIANLLIALICVKAKFYLPKNLTKKDIIIIEDNKDVSGKFTGYINKTLEEYNGDNTEEVSLCIASILEEIADTTYQINSFNGSTVNLYDLCSIYNENDDVKEHIDYLVNNSDQYYDTEKNVEATAESLINLIKQDRNNCYNYIIPSVSKKQFSQAFVNISFKPDLYGNVIPRAVNTSYLRGLRDPIDYFITSVGARKALITNSTYVRSAGYLSRKLILLVINLKKSLNEDCGSKEYIIFKIENEAMLKRLHGRYYYDIDSKKLLTINKHRKELIGHVIHLRSPTHCLDKDTGVCNTCLGTIQKKSKFHLALAGMIKLADQIIQILLSSKHLLQINPEKINLPKIIQDYFSVDKTNLIAKKDFKIKIEDIQYDEDTDEAYVNSITILDSGKEIIFELEDKELYLDILGEKIDYSSFENIISVYEEDEVLRIMIENSEVATPLKKILKIIENEGILNSYSIHLLLPELLNLLNKSNIRASSLTIEFILRELMRDPNDLQERPKDFNNVKFLKLTSALFESPSAAVSLAFERHKNLLENNIFKKQLPSVLDKLF